ncbi:MAG: nicotinamidase [Desulfurococcales archaeon]|nr:nicotinamidase [Desulfurococcales archaeon]
MLVPITKKSALIVVDMQKDFCSSGSLPVPGCDELIPKINALIKTFKSLGLPVIFSRDWHPPNHSSFKDFGGVWPPHCIQGTEGAEFHEDLEIPEGSIIISKGASPERDAYSAFDGTELHYLLSLRNVRRVFVCGVATDYCVKETALDALRLGYEVIVIEDAAAPVSVDGGRKALKEILRFGGIIAESREVVTY